MKTNPLGNIRAENDSLLEQVFYETPEYRSLIEEHETRVVVGRRGTGKSALFHMLKRHWASVHNTLIIPISPSETEMIGLRSFVNLFGTKSNYIKAALRIAWQYALLHEVLAKLANHYKVRAAKDLSHISSLTETWQDGEGDLVLRLCKIIKERVDKNLTIEERIAGLAQTLDLRKLILAARGAIEASGCSVQIAADNLDEGYEPDEVGISILTALINAAGVVTSALPRTATTIFLRDNIFRSIQATDPDYSRNIEGDVLRLHWDEYHLFNMICNRIREVFGILQEKNLHAWNKVTARDIRDKEGFRKCLRFTLYRPRDLLVLLNIAFNHARSHGRETIVNDDIEASAHEISCSRLDDLKKEYREVIPGIDALIGPFAGGRPRISVSDITEMMHRPELLDGMTPEAGQVLAIMESSLDIVHTLYSVGFLGVWSTTSACFVFCHDGKKPDISVDMNSQVLVHPCYWIALNLKEEVELSGREVEEIHDEYDINISSETPTIRDRNLGKIASDLNLIEGGVKHASNFEKWCLRAIRVLFAVGIVNAELHPNKNSTQRRDIVGRNTSKTDAWKRVLEDYQCRQVVFEVKNYSDDLGGDEYRQMTSYLCAEYGRLGFIINRSQGAELEKGRELDWVREMYHEHNKVIIKLPASLLAKWISKLRNPKKHDIADKALENLLDYYERHYLRLGGSVSRKVKKRKT